MYNQVRKRFEDFQTTILQTSPAFTDSEYISTLAQQITQLRGRELPGFMSSQTFYMCMSSYVDLWEDGIAGIVKAVGDVAVQVAGRMAEVLLAPYPGKKLYLYFVHLNMKFLYYYRFAEEFETKFRSNYRVLHWQCLGSSICTSTTRERSLHFE
jgi:hypothetical protein